MSDSTADFIRRERVTDALLEFERRIRERTLPLDQAECWDILYNRLPSHGVDPPGKAAPAPALSYETREGVSMLHVRQPGGENRACIGCDLFGRSHCGGGLVFLYYALREAGVADPLSLMTVEIEPGVYMPDWELMADHSRTLMHHLREYFEANLSAVSDRPD